MTSIAYETPASATRLPFTDRRTSIKAAGVVLIVLGGLAGCVSAATPVGMYFSAMAARSAPTTGPAAAAGVAAQPDVRGMVVGLVTYVAVAVLFIWCGIAAVRLRRWVRPVMLVVSWTWLVSGVFATILSINAARGFRGALAAAMAPGSPPPPPAFIYAMVAVTTVFTGLFMVALPAMLVWIFQRRGVRETVEYFDPRAAWTDRCPTPVLAVALWLVLAGVGLLSYLAFDILPLFGTIVTGPAAIAGIVVLSLLLFTLAWSVYRLRPPAWWGTVAVAAAMSASMILTVARQGVGELYRSAGYTPEQITLMTRFGGVGASGMIAFAAAAGALMVGYLLYVRRYFVANDAPEAG